MKPSSEVVEILENQREYRDGMGRLAGREGFLALLDYVQQVLQPPHLGRDAVLKRLEEARERGPGRGDIYMHHKALTKDKKPKNAYMVLHVGLTAAGCEPVVVYQDLQDPRLVWVRELWDWLKELQDEEHGATFRFHQVGSLAPLVEV